MWNQREELRRVAEDLEQIRAHLRHWDPIGVIHPEVLETWDEYDSYAPHVLGMLLNGCDADALGRHLA